MKKTKILVKNDDRINSPGLEAAVKAVMDLGDVTVVAPSFQQTGMGRSLTGNKETKLTSTSFNIDGKEVPAFHCECSPALVTKYALKILFSDKKPDLVISGINYGENLGINVTTSGTIGAALEASSFGIPSIAISKQTEIDSHHKYTYQDWATSSYFLNKFAKVLINKSMPIDVDVLKIDIPNNATSSTPWKLSNLAKTNYYTSYFEKPSLDCKLGDVKLKIDLDHEKLDPDSDIYIFAVEKCIPVTPISLDSTSRATLSSLQEILNDE